MLTFFFWSKGNAKTDDSGIWPAQWSRLRGGEAGLAWGRRNGQATKSLKWNGAFRSSKVMAALPHAAWPPHPFVVSRGSNRRGGGFGRQKVPRDTSAFLGAEGEGKHRNAQGLPAWTSELPPTMRRGWKNRKRGAVPNGRRLYFECGRRGAEAYKWVLSPDSANIDPMIRKLGHRRPDGNRQPSATQWFYIPACVDVVALAGCRKGPALPTAWQAKPLSCGPHAPRQTTLMMDRSWNIRQRPKGA